MELKIPYHFAKKHGVVAIQQTNDTALVYHLPNTKIDVFSEIKRVLQRPLTPIEVNQAEFQQHLANFYQSQTSAQDVATGMVGEINLDELASQLPTSEDLLDNKDDAPVIRLINAIFTQAIKQHASDIHIETYENGVLVRNRIDGVLQQVLEIQRNIAPFVISRIKVMAKLDIAEKRIPQDGRIALQIGGHKIDVRVSTLPSNHGERVVLRILDQKAAKLELSSLGMPQKIQDLIHQLISQPHGILLVTGPTGSGKTTSLYAMLRELNQVSRNILTIEDPIEYDLPGIGQTQVNAKVQMTFAKGLRAILRQDPDVVMIGEIRDLETAEIAVQASLTGHLVLSTLHTNTALSALVRLRDIGVESFLLASSVIGLMAQRLVRKLCDNCKTPHNLRDDEYELMGLCKQTLTSTVFSPKGCDKCNHTGYRGRTGIYEVIMLDEALRSMIHRNESQEKIEQYLRPKSPDIRHDGFQRVLAGETSIAEILRVTSA